MANKKLSANSGNLVLGGVVEFESIPALSGGGEVVDTVSAQTIGGAKTFTSAVSIDAGVGTVLNLEGSTTSSNINFSYDNTNRWLAGTNTAVSGGFFLYESTSGEYKVTVSTAGAVTLGPVSDTLVHTLNGSIAVTTAPSVSFSNVAYKSIGSSGCQLLLSDGTTTTDDMFLFGGGYYSGANHYAQENNTNLTRIGLYGTTSLSTIAFRVDRMRNGATDFTSTGQVTTQDTLVNLGNVTAAGAWTLGPSTGTFALAHKLWTTSGTSSGNVSIDTTGSIANNTSSGLVVMENGSTQAALSLYKHSGNTKGFGHLNLNDQNGSSVYVWAWSGALRYSTNAAHIGTANGTAL